ncbi:MAG: AAA family ATPase [Pseudomonadota bacterium]|nr:AAA family ATPase [Pseudomonadota bacterium]
MPVLVSFSGLPGVGKTTIAKALCQQTSAIYIRVDVIESALRESVLKIDPCEDAGYLAACGVARSNLLLGRSVIADTVNPVEASRQLWQDTADTANATLFNIEVVCSDTEMHRNRVETREADIEGHPLPDWHRVETRQYEPWTTVDLKIDTAVSSVAHAVETILNTLKAHHLDFA